MAELLEKFPARKKNGNDTHFVCYNKQISPPIDIRMARPRKEGVSDGIE
jgi:hypothetical protein